MSKNLSGEFILQQKTAIPSSESRSDSASSKSDDHPHTHYPEIRRHSLNFLSSLCIDPQNVTIVSQDPDETIHILVRRHHITNLPWILLVIFLLFVPLLIPIFSQPFSFIQVSPFTTTSFLLLYYLSLFGYSLLKFAEWYFHVGLITNKRLVDIDMHNILSKNVAETEIAAVEDVAYTQKGILQSVFRYGTVNIQTEAVEANFEFDKVSHPSQVAEIINQLANAARDKSE